MVFIFSVIILFSNCGAPELTPSQKFDKLRIGMPLQEALDIFGLKDTIGKSYTNRYGIAKLDTTNPDAVPTETGEILEVLSVALDTVYTITLAGDSIYNKIDNTEFNRIMRESDRRNLEKESK